MFKAILLLIICIFGIAEQAFSQDPEPYSDEWFRVLTKRANEKKAREDSIRKYDVFKPPVNYYESTFFLENGSYDKETQNIYGDNFLGYFHNGIFVDLTDSIKYYQYDTYRSTFPINRTYWGIDRTGKQFESKLDSIFEQEGVFDPTISSTNISGFDSGSTGYILSLSKANMIKIIDNVEDELFYDEVASPHKIVIDSLFKSANTYREDGEEYLNHTITDGTRWRITHNGEEYYLYKYQLSLSGMPISPDRFDYRGSVFIITDKNDTITYKSFGHGEWSPSSEDIVTISPYFFFEMEGYENPLMFCEYSSGWESMTSAIFDLKLKKSVLKAYK